jgi:hypothetical protein
MADEDSSQVGLGGVGDLWVGSSDESASIIVSEDIERNFMMQRTEIKQTTISPAMPTPVTLVAMDATAVSTTLSAAATSAQSFLILASLSGLVVDDILLLDGSERALITLLKDGSSIASSSLNTGGTGWTVGNTFTVNTGNGDATGIVNTVSGSAVATYTITNTGSGYVTGTGVATTHTSGTGTGLTIDISGTAAIPHASSASAVDIGVGNIINSSSSQTMLLFVNSDSLTHTVTMYGPTGSQSYPLAGGGTLIMGRLQLANFVQTTDTLVGGSIWANTSSALVFMAAFKAA